MSRGFSLVRAELADRCRLTFFSARLNQRSAPCRSRASVLAARIEQFPPAGPATAYRLRNAQSDSVFDIGQRVRTSGMTSEQSSRDIRGAAMNLSSLGPNLEAGTSSNTKTFVHEGRYAPYSNWSSCHECRIWRGDGT